MKFFTLLNDNKVIMISLKKISFRKKRSYCDENEPSFSQNLGIKKSGLSKSESIKQGLSDLEKLTHRMKQLKVDSAEEVNPFSLDQEADSFFFEESLLF